MLKDAQKNRKLYVLLTQFPGLDSKAMRCYTRFPYTHASVGLDEDLNTFYSFVTKGFIVEDICRYNKPDRDPFPCALYELEVSQTIYDAAKQMLQNFVKNRASLRYDTLGLFLSLVRIPKRRKGRYFCSQFVAEILKRCNATDVNKNTALYLPKDLHALRDLRLIFQGDLLRMSRQFVPG